MPEFILNDTNASRAYAKLSEFAFGYIEAMFFTNGDCGDDNEHLLNELGTVRLTRDAIRNIASDCDKFLGTIMPDGCFAHQWIDRAQALEPGSPEFRYAKESLDDRRCGHLFWYTRQGHGVSWNDDGSADCLDGLQEASRKFGEAYVEVSRGWIYHR